MNILTTYTLKYLRLNRKRTAVTILGEILSAALTFGFYVVGNFNNDLRNFDRIVESKAAIWLARGVYHVLPDFSAFDVKMEVVHGLAVPAGYMAGTILYGLVYITALLVLSVLIFSRRDFK